VSTVTGTSVKMSIDGREVVAQQGETVLAAATRAGIEIPALCHQEGMPAWGACRLCLIEVEGWGKLQAACTTWVQEGLVVDTQSERVRAKRASYLRMYLSDHNAYCEAPCTDACPTHIDIPAYMKLIEDDDFAGAAAVVRRELPFPGILGRVCPRYCEPVCRRGEVDEPIAICALHRAAGDHTPAVLRRGPATGKRVAVIGAGPSGLACAWYLAETGHEVTVYDRNEKPGGMLRYSIPEFRLPESVLDAELAPLWDAGVRFVDNVGLGADINTYSLLQAGFDAVFVGVGAWQTMPPRITNRDVAVDGLKLLREVKDGKTPKLGASVVVLGDGTTAVDAARTARRLGAAKVTVLAPHAEHELPGGARDLQAAREEGVAFEFNVEARAIKLAKTGKPSAVECVRLERGKGGKLVEIKGSGFDVKTGAVIAALAWAPDLGEAEDDLAVRPGERLAANYYTGRTATEGVFASGDAVTGAKSAIHAMAGGKRAALAIDGWLKGVDLEELESKLALYAGLPHLQQLKDEAQLGELGKRLAERSPVWLKMGINAQPEDRTGMPSVAASKRTLGFEEVEKGFKRKAAKAEAARCLQCTCPSNGECDLQTLGVEYGITENELVMTGGDVRDLRPRHEHPFIQRDMDRCIACGSCVRVCRDVAGPACYDFSGRGFLMEVDTAYGSSLQMADCITCGRCVTACPTGALTFNERALTSYKVDESRCILCHQCVDVCPVDAVAETTVFEDARREWHELTEQKSKLAGGHRMCAGCGAPIVVRQVLMGTDDPVVVSAATGCLEVSTTIYPYTSWTGSFIHTAFENAAATLSGVETAFRSLKKQGKLEDNVKFIAFGGDGGTYDIGLQSLSGAMERGHNMLYVCYDNGAYMNTGFQRSGATPIGAWTTTSPVGKATSGKQQTRKDLTEIMIAHGIKYVAQASPHDPRDLVRKAARALATDGPSFLNVLSPCPRGWRTDGADSIELAREAVNNCYWPLYEVEDGVYRITYMPKEKMPLKPWLKRQGRFAHMFKPGNEWMLENVQAWVDHQWEMLLRRSGLIDICTLPPDERWVR
jgi:NADPH-dependent glutamate synthase beta subunit-like oxidoreductase/pyruvate/2-oxoacid:ferredoxin oxidoreductase beta subunit/Pyruvate/2-oxoacid:ferredoxin oxidoreductase delta subunit